MRKLILTFLITSFVTTNIFSQSEFDIQVKKMSDTLVKKLLSTGKKRITVSNFLDLQGNVTELGRYLAEIFSVELSNSALEVVDRSRLKDLLNELKLTDEKLTKPENALKLGELSGVEYIITGTITMLDNTADITLKALDIQKGLSIAGLRGSLKRTDAINNLMRSTVTGSGATSANVNAARKIDTDEKSATDDLFETKISALRKGECTKTNYGRTNTFGQVCFENQTGEDIFFVCNAEGANSNFLNYDKIPLTQSSRNCSALIYVNRYNESNPATEIVFTFQTINSEKVKSGTMTVNVEACKVKSIVLTKKNLLLMAK